MAEIRSTGEALTSEPAVSATEEGGVDRSDPVPGGAGANRCARTQGTRARSVIP
jgi:hypothetical protein